MKLGHKTFSKLVTSIACTLTLVFSVNAVAQSGTFRARLSPMPTTPQTVTTITGEGEVILTLEGVFFQNWKFGSRSLSKFPILHPHSPLTHANTAEYCRLFSVFLTYWQ